MCGRNNCEEKLQLMVRTNFCGIVPMFQETLRKWGNDEGRKEGEEDIMNISRERKSKILVWIYREEATDKNRDSDLRPRARLRHARVEMEGTQSNPNNRASGCHRERTVCGTLARNTTAKSPKIQRQKHHPVDRSKCQGGHPQVQPWSPTTDLKLARVQ